MKPRSSRQSGSPVVDEAAFQQLLSAAFVMQEHNGRVKKAPQPSQQNTMPASNVMPAKATVIEPVSLPETKQAASACQECGSSLGHNEFFCENCGAPAERPHNTTQKNWASLWEMHQASQCETKLETEEHDVPVIQAKAAPQEEAAEEIDLFPSELEEIVGKFAAPGEEEALTVTAESETSTDTLALSSTVATPTEIAETTPTATWSSAAKARAWFDSIQPQKSKDWFRDEWNFHRGLISIALASAVLLAVLFQWVTRPDPAPGQQHQLSTFEEMLVKIGLAEAPAPTAPAAQPGNPTTRVWVDVHTALYYCPGAELYGKTANGKYTTQLDAQRDNFQPSTLKACD